MRREDIANFLTAERRISPLSAFSLLIVAGFIAGSLQLVAPSDPNVMMAQAAAPTNTSANLDSSAPKDCTEAIQKALGKDKGPQATTVDQGKSGTADKCFGGVLNEAVAQGPSMKTTDYKCVGRSGKVTITSDSATSVTNPDKAVPPGSCKVEVCQPIPGVDPAGKPTVNPNCGPAKQFSAGQSITPQTGGVPQIPTSSTGTGGTSAPNTPKPNGSGDIPPVQLLDGPNTTPPAPTPNGGTAADQLGKIGAPVTGALPPSQGFPDVPGATVPTQPGTSLQPNTFPVDGAQPISNLNSPGSGYDPNAQFQPNAQQETTFPNGQPLNAQTYPTTPPASDGFTAANNPNTWKYGAQPVDTYGQPDVKLPTLEQSTMSEWSKDAMTNPGYAKIGTSPTSWNDVPTSVAPPVQDLDNGINTQITCTDAGCTAKPTTPADTTALQKNGFTCANGNCTRAAQNPPDLKSPGACPGTIGCPGRETVQTPPYVDPRTQTPPPSSPTQPSPSGSGSNALMSLLAGMMKGLGGAQQSQQQQGPAPTCSTDKQQYAQQQQQYNQQLQQYNYQMQQYNYQQQVNYDRGYSSYSSPPPPLAPQPCQNGNGAGQCPQLPAQPPASACPTGTWRQMTTAQSTGSVCPVWQCVTGSGTAPTAQLTCDPSIVERGTPINMTYSCTNSTTSTGYGFTTGGAVSGATTSTTLNAPENAAGANFALKCENGSLSAAAQCTVQIAKVSISLRAEPEVASIGSRALIGWVTTGMESCTISSPDQPEFTDRNASRKTTAGIATTSPITADSNFVLNCKTLTGGFKQETVTVYAYTPGTVTASIENRADVRGGQRATIRWNFQDAPDVSAVALWLYSVEDKQTVALIAGHRAKAGTYEWDIPTANDPCNVNASNVCGIDLIPGRSYQILATLYAPPNAGLGEFDDPNLPEPVFIDSPITRSFRISQ